MSHWKNVGGVFASTLGLVFTLAVLGGNTQPICGSSEPSSTVCLTDADCTAEADASCNGAWACIESECQWQCTVQPVGCYSDNDCAEGTHCSVSDGVCNAPPDCPMCDVCFGACVADVTPPATCQSDDQCQADQYCDFAGCPMYGAADRMPCAPDSEGCGIVPPVCEGVCTTRPVVTGCTADSECGDGQICQLEQRCYAVDCADGTDCGAPMPCEAVGVCVPAPSGCWADDECPAGFQCVFTDACPPIDCKPNEPCPMIDCQAHGVCEPIATPDCVTDADCDEGFYCEPTYKCDPMTNCDAAGNCGDEKCLGSGGVCVPYQTSACDTVKCAAGTHCEEITECYDTDCVAPDGSMCDPAIGTGGCSTYAQCVPDSLGCADDAECPMGYVCELYPCDCAPYDNGTGAEVPVDCYCEAYGQCVPSTQPTCTTDADCKPGSHCEIDSWCGCADGMNCPDAESWCIGGGVCVPDPQPLCLTDSDCAAGETCNALDVCILLDCASPECSYCHGYCVAEQKPCYGDGDCPAGQVCQMPPYMDPTTGAMACCPTNSDLPCLMIYPSCEGMCVPAATEICWNGLDDDGDGLVDEGCGQQVGCVSDADCQWYETCSFATYGADAAMPACCPAGALCGALNLPPCDKGVCTLMDGYCWTNGDCAAGETCEGATMCPPGAYCLVAAGPGKCAPGNPGEVCGNGQDDDGDGLVDEGCEGACPDGTMCAPGEVCQEEAVCPDCTYSNPPCMMPCMLQYVCVPAQPNPCVVSGCSGQICAPEPMASDCMWKPWYACFGLAACEQQPTGACGWTPNPEFKQCLLDNGGAGF